MDIILLGHGSRRGKDTDLGLEEVRRRLQLRVNSGRRVRMAGLEFTPPSLEESVLRLAAEGSKDMLVVPFFLFRGRHLKEEIPQDVARINALVPHVSLRLTANLGLDSRLADMAVERVRSMLPAAPGTGSGVVLVRRGSRPEYDSGEELVKLAENVSGRMAMPVEPAQAQFGRPTIDEAIRSLARLNLKAIVVMPYLFFPGKVLYDNVVVETDKARGIYPGIAFSVTPTLGVDDRLVDIVMERIRDTGYRMEEQAGCEFEEVN